MQASHFLNGPPALGRPSSTLPLGSRPLTLLPAFGEGGHPQLSLGSIHYRCLSRVWVQGTVERREGKDVSPPSQTPLFLQKLKKEKEKQEGF